MSDNVSVALLPPASIQPISVNPGQALPENAWMATLNEALGFITIAAVVALAKKLNQISEPVVPVLQAGAGAQGSNVVVGSKATWLDNEVPAAGHPVNQDWLNTTAFENCVPPPNICELAKRPVLTNNTVNTRVFLNMDNKF